MKVDPSIVRRSAVILSAIAIPWVGCSLWSSHRERAEKEVLAAEIRAEIESRPPWTDPAARRRDLTAEYDAILAGLGNDRDTSALASALEDRTPWTGVPKVVSAELAAHAVALTELDALADRSEPGRANCFGGTRWKQWRHLRLLLNSRGRSCIARERWDGLSRTIRGLRRAADDALASFVLPGRPDAAGTAGGLEDEALAILAIAAAHTSLPEPVAVELRSLTDGPSVREPAYDAIREWRRNTSDKFCLDLLGDDAEGAMKGAGMRSGDSFLDRMERILPGRGDRPERLAPTAPPRAETMRRMREIAARIREAEAHRDAAALALGGPLDVEADQDLGDGWTGCHAFIYPVWSRNRWRMEARLPVLRAAFAIRIHEARTGRVPETLAELVPSILDAVPVDAWTGKPVVFVPGPGTGWLLEAGPPIASFRHAAGVTETTEPWQLRKN